MTGQTHPDNTTRAQKSVHLIPGDAAIKRLCFDAATQSLRPNLVLVDRQGSVVFEINELGLKGAARDPARKLVVVWGDSVVFGVRWGWPCLLDGFDPRYQFLNGGIEADPYDNILRRVAAFNRAHDVALNILLLGWHPLAPPAELAKPPDRAATGLGRIAATLWERRRHTTGAALPGRAEPQPKPSHPQLRADLVECLQCAPNTALVTMPTALNRNTVDRDLSSYFRPGNRDTVFDFAGDVAYSVTLQRYLFDHISERNRIVREVAKATGAHLVDLAAQFDTEPIADFRQDFFDVLHLRPRAYPKAAAAVYAGIRGLL